MNLDNNYMRSLTCLTPLSSETIEAVASAREATTTILTLRVACRRGKAEVRWSLLLKKQLLYIPNANKCAYSVLVVQAMSVYKW